MRHPDASAARHRQRVICQGNRSNQQLESRSARVAGNPSKGKAARTGCTQIKHGYSCVVVCLGPTRGSE